MSDMSRIPVIAVVGPTASGKTDVGIRIAQAVDGEVLCVDSRTVYKGMDIGTAKVEGVKGEKWQTGTWDIATLFDPAPIIADGIPHWGVDLVAPNELFTVADFRNYAQKKIADIVKRGKVPVLVGGTGLYFRAVLDGLTLTDVVPNAALRAELELLSTEALAEMLGKLDPDAAATIDTDNRRRLLRAIEIVRGTGAPLAMAQQRVVTPYAVCWIGVAVLRAELYQRIDERVDAMIARGLIDEARRLYEQYGGEAQAMSGIGYRQLVAFFQGVMPLRDAVARIKFDTHHYAKRQETWFCGDPRVQWESHGDGAVDRARRHVGK